MEGGESGEGGEGAGGPWVSGYTEEGYQYWYNMETGESSWNDPAGTADGATAAADGAIAVEDSVAEDSASAASIVGDGTVGGAWSATPVASAGARPFGLALPVPFDLDAALAAPEAVEALRTFPGPLTPASSSVGLIEYTSRAAATFASAGAAAAPLALLWKLLSLLLKLNGVLDGSTGDESAAELLEALRGGSTDGAHALATAPSSGGGLGGGAGGSSPLARAAGEGTDAHAFAVRYESLLLDGRRHDACALAMERGMWADALLLSSHMDADTWRLVMSRYATETLVPGSPLRTLYTLFAGSGPEEVINATDCPIRLAGSPAEIGAGGIGGGIDVVDDAGGGIGSGTPGGVGRPLARLVGSWREQLAMMLANPTAGDTEVIARLGDEVWAVHGAAAAHCCYVLAELPAEGPACGLAVFEAHTRMLLLAHDHRDEFDTLGVHSLQGACRRLE